ncbi:MAG: two-component system response regulator [Elusimicrobia bacterium GWA2_56_46]|nr:MAG: two-component system response regulator [Elusimicrobia bacterium GWA2_56_46]OGR55198.1 MAG: two-component system response regulator [Elusimicrobia bacterium GWC2_56_31]HBB66280.1 two-component system response regulator [Elusimicrobiota bacterium]HBW23728.1 two-component system response regulator [Elusimicrobiota bacterium]
MAKILVVDDSKFMRLTLRNLLEKGSKGQHQVIGEAANVEEAVEQYNKLKPDLVTMDMIMPEAVGLEAVKRIVACDPSAKVIMVSAMGQEKIVQESISVGAKGFVTKPVKAEELMKVVGQALGMTV